MPDRLKELQARAVAAAANQPSETANDTIVEMDEIQPEESTENAMAPFFAQVKRVRDTLTKIEEDIEFVSSKHSEILVQYSQAKAKEINDELHTRMDKISLSANRLRKELKVMSHQTEQAEAEGTDSEGNLTADVRTRKSVQSMLSRKFIEVMKRYNEVQAENKKKYKEHVRRKCRIDNQDIEDEKIDEMLESGTVDSLFTGKKLTEAKDALHEIQDRHQDILQLEKSLLELHEMFVDMAMLIEQQGEMIDRIEFSVERSSVYVEKALQNTRQAQKLQSSARHKKFCCLAVLIIGVTAIVLIALFT